MDRIKRRHRLLDLGLSSRRTGGFILPLVVMISGLLFAAIGAIIFSLTVQSRNRVILSQREKTEMTSERGPQNGLVLLSKRLSYLPDRIANGVTVSGETKRITESDIGNYVLISPASFWMDWLNDITEEGVPVETQPNFTKIDNDTVAYTVETTEHVITIKLISALNLGLPVQDASSNGYNNVTLRYGYEITAQQKIPGANNSFTLGKSITIASVLRADQADKLIQVHLARELSRFNLFAISDKMSDGSILFDRTSYTGPVYLRDTMYVDGTPTFTDAVQISNLASPPVFHRTLHESFPLRKPGGTSNPYTVVQPLDMPTTSNMESIKAVAHKMAAGQNPDALTVPYIYRATATISGTEQTVAIYVNATDLQEVTLVISNPNGSTNRYRVIHGSQDVSWDQNVTLNQNFLIFVDGKLNIEGTLAERSKVTIVASGDVVITNDLKYLSGTVGPDTILGLVSWNGNILISRNIPPPFGQPIKNLYLHAVLMAVNGAFGAEGYQDFATNYAGYAGTVYHTGAFIRRWNLPTLSVDGTKGWGLQTVYDTFLAQSKAPPYFPGNGNYKLIDQSLCAVVEVYTIKK